MNILSSKAVTVAIVFWYCHSGPNSSEDAITFLTWTNCRETPFVKQQHEPNKHFIICFCPQGSRDVDERMIGLGNGRVWDPHFQGQRTSCPLPGLVSQKAPVLAGPLPRWAPGVSLSVGSYWQPLPSHSSLLTSGQSFPRAPFSLQEPQVLFTLGVCWWGRTKENRCTFPLELFNLVNYA